MPFIFVGYPGMRGDRLATLRFHPTLMATGAPARCALQQLAWSPIKLTPTGAFCSEQYATCATEYALIS
jgi:hypothetical protein